MLVFAFVLVETTKLAASLILVEAALIVVTSVVDVTSDLLAFVRIVSAAFVLVWEAAGLAASLASLEAALLVVANPSKVALAPVR